MTLLFLVAYLFYNDGIQTVIGVAAGYGDQELGFSESVLIATILLVQFVASAARCCSGGSPAWPAAGPPSWAAWWGWVLIVSLAFTLPAGRLVPFLALATAIASCSAGPRRCPVGVQPAGAARPGGGVLQPLPGL